MARAQLVTARPEVNRFVRYSYRDVYEGAVDAEMVSYKPAPH
jgi:hypothetical protein